MKTPQYLKYVFWSDEDECYVGTIPDLCGECCHGQKEDDVYRQLLVIHDEWIEIFKEDGMPLPPVRTRPVMQAV